ncbi:LysR family transcriptional regulator [Pusillimonas sp. TS35]|uniref:LysR substrate-binding domain-containing protein n=1 Tax=Paracandidimonas lactea TaxID=2895524 RepID=UPI0013699FD5|nr:LysR substrate-binding domain-containing protein [Paracandidimonas lactea]MYN14865.1 LysR family transcriptional regulator [Pusillimonas sp. TS35]
MDIRSLRYFIETVRLKSFTKAATSLGVTQSTISKMVRQLENEIGEALLLRDTQPPALTDCGKVVYERGLGVLAAMGQLQADVRKTQSVEAGTLDVGIPPMINMLFTGVVKTFRACFPGIVLRLHEDTGREIERQVAAGELEIGLTILPVEPGLGIVAREVNSHAVWAVGEPSLLRDAQGTLRFGTLRDRPLVLMNDDFAITRRLRAEFAQAGFAPRIAAQSGQWDWTVSMARAGMGLALLPEPFVQLIKLDGLTAARLTQPDLRWQVAHIWNGRYLSHAAQAWLEICEAELGGRWLD